MKRLLFIAATLVTAFTSSLTGCGKNPQSSSPGTVKLSIRAMSGALAKASGSQAQQVTITAAQVVLDEIEIESTNRDSMDFKADSAMVVNLNLTGAMTTVGTVTLPFGTYDELELEIHQLDPQDGTVYTANSNLQNRSIYVQGYVGGDTTATFVFTSTIEVEQEQDLSPPLVISNNTPATNIVLTIDTSVWFSDGTGGFLDPRLAQNRQAIEKNIRASINAFEDDDDDGEADDDDDDADDDDDGIDDDDDDATDDDATGDDND
jgi:hypothetical protein